MTRKHSTIENTVKSRKQSQQPHGKIKSLAELSEEYDAEHQSRQ